jgi:aminoglycoside phosphotransferase (APT) family kinase protein
MTPDQQTLIDRLQTYLSEQLDAPVRITAAKPLAGGASRDTWLFTVTYDDETHQWVMRRDLPTQMFDDALTRAQEYRLMDAAYQSGVTVAPVRLLCTDTDVLGSPFFIMDYVAGISIGRKVMTLPELDHARRQLPQQMARELATIHALDVDAHGLDFLLRPPAGQSPAAAIVAQVRAILDQLQVNNPTWEWTLRWAETHLPDPNPLSFVHGDFRIGNLLVDEAGLSAVIDWEFGHMGDPDEELGYLCMRDWRFGNGEQRAAGLTDRESFIKAYEAHSGRSVRRASVDWWELIGNIRWGVICMSQANRHLSGADPSVELASLGRRSAEMQLEALHLIESYGI